jgi:hypothetical protein
VSIWLVIWLFLSGALLYFLGWTIYILFRQKTAWKKFAAQKKLRYRSVSLFGPPEMSGTFDNHPVSFFVGEHMAADARSSRKLTAVEVKLASRMPFDAGIASGGMVPVMKHFNFRDELRPDHSKWDKNYIAATSYRMALQAYLTPERIEALTSMMRIRNSWTIFIFRDDTVLLRFDTPDALDTIEKLNKILLKMCSVVNILELHKGEEGILKAEMTKRPAKEINIAVDDRDFNEAQGFQLEEDHLPESTDKPPQEN